MDYMIQTGPATEGARSALTAIRNLREIKIPSDVGIYHTITGKTLTDKHRKGIQKLFKFIEHRKMLSTYNGYPHALFTGQLSIAPKTAKVETASRDAEISDKDVFVTYKALDERVKPFFALLAFSGIRSAQAYDLLSQPAGKRFEIITGKREGDPAVKEPVARGKIKSDVKKLGYYAYIPPEYVPVFEAYVLPLNLDNMNKVINSAGKEAATIPASAANLRKWNLNAMTTGADPIIDIPIAGLIQSRQSKNVTIRNYAAIGKHTAEGYSKIQGKLRRILKVTEDILPTRTPASRKAPASGRAKA